MHSIKFSKVSSILTARWREAAVLVGVSLLYFSVAPAPLPDGNPALDAWEQRIGEAAREKAADAKAEAQYATATRKD